MIKFWIYALLALSLAVSPFTHATSQLNIEEVIAEGNTFTPLKPDRAQREASIHIARQLLLSHYRKQDIDKELSAKVYDNYLDSLDNQHLYFLQSDINEFEPYRYRLHGALKTGQLEPGFRIFNRYQQRLLERLNYQLGLIEKGLDKLDFTKDEYILADRESTKFAKDMSELQDVWRRQLKSAALSLKFSGKEMDEVEENLTKRYESQLRRALQVRNEDAFQAYMNAFTTVYDPHTTYFSPRTSENFNINMSLSLEGIGAVLQSDNDYTKVVRLVPAGPAEKQGQLKPADRIVGVGQGEDGDIVNVIGWRLDEVVDLIRGPKHSVVRLEVIPGTTQDESDLREIAIKRDKVKLEDQAAASNVLEVERNGTKNRIGVIEIPTFYADFQAMQEGDPNYKSTTRDVLKLLNEMQEGSGIDGLVIDLRGNGGGSLDEANRLTGLFITEGPTVQIRSANNRVELMRDPDPKLAYMGPLVVLVDRLSASASEIFAAAIQDYNRGVIMGSPTFGKGTVQSVRPLNHGQLKITQAKFYRISGASTQHKGVIPDIHIPDIVDRSRVGEDALEGALQWDSIKPAKYASLADIQSVTGKLKDNHVKRFETNPEYQLLLEEIALLDQQRSREKITLNEAKRKEENAKRDQAQLDIINKRRVIEGLATFKTLEEWETYEEERVAAGEEDEGPDFIVEESAEILIDFIEMQRVLAASAA